MHKHMATLPNVTGLQEIGHTGYTGHIRGGGLGVCKVCGRLGTDKIKANGS